MKNLLKQLFSFAIVIFLSFNPQPCLAAGDVFEKLENLNLNDNVSKQILQLGQKSQIQTQKSELYSFPSEKFSLPHFLEVKDNKITFIQLTIPAKQEIKYHQIYDTYPATDRIILTKTKAEILIGIPKKGVGFVLNGYENKIIILKKFPPKSVDEFLIQEGLNYQPVDADPRSRMNKLRTSPPAKTAGQLSKYGYIIIISSGFILLVIILLIRRKFLAIPKDGKVYLEDKYISDSQKTNFG
jgi:hypothetical protein